MRESFRICKKCGSIRSEKRCENCYLESGRRHLRKVAMKQEAIRAKEFNFVVREELVQIKTKSERRCAIANCVRRADEILFVGDFCEECYRYVTGVQGGENSQAFRNAMGAAAQILRERSMHLVAAKILEKYFIGDLRWWKRPEYPTRKYEAGKEDEEIIAAGAADQDLDDSD